MLSSLDTVLDLGDDTLLWPGEVPLPTAPSPMLCLAPEPSQFLTFLETGKLSSWLKGNTADPWGSVGGADTDLPPGMLDWLCDAHASHATVQLPRQTLACLWPPRTQSPGEISNCSDNYGQRPKQKVVCLSEKTVNLVHMY